MIMCDGCKSKINPKVDAYSSGPIGVPTKVDEKGNVLEWSEIRELCVPCLTKISKALGILVELRVKEDVKENPDDTIKV